jgi:hypothetical protein
MYLGISYSKSAEFKTMIDEVIRENEISNGLEENELTIYHILILSVLLSPIAVVAILVEKHGK